MVKHTIESYATLGYACIPLFVQLAPHGFQQKRNGDHGWTKMTESNMKFLLSAENLFIDQNLEYYVKWGSELFKKRVWRCVVKFRLFSCISSSKY